MNQFLLHFTQASGYAYAFTFSPYNAFWPPKDVQPILSYDARNEEVFTRYLTDTLLSCSI